MRLLQRFILFDLLRVFCLLLSALTVLLVFVGVLHQMTENGLGPDQVLEILPYVVPSMMPFTIPATLLLAICVVFGRASGDQEITAVKAAGINVLSLLWPSFMVGLVLSIGSFFLTDRTIPWAISNIQATVARQMESIFLDMLRAEHLIADHDRGYEIMVDDVRGKVLIGTTIRYIPPGREHAVVLTAKEAEIEFNIERQEVILHFFNWAVDGGQVSAQLAGRNSLRFPFPRQMQDLRARHLSLDKIAVHMDYLEDDLVSTRLKFDIESAMAITRGDFNWFSGTESKGFTAQLQKEKADLAKFDTEVHSRWAMATSCFFFALLGGPFAISQSRRQFITIFFICFLPILLVYYPLVMLMMNLSKTGHVNPAWAMWTGNALLLCVSIYVLKRVLRH